MVEIELGDGCLPEWCGNKRETLEEVASLFLSCSSSVLTSLSPKHFSDNMSRAVRVDFTPSGRLTSFLIYDVLKRHFYLLYSSCDSKN